MRRHRNEVHSNTCRRRYCLWAAVASVAVTTLSSIEPTLFIASTPNAGLRQSESLPVRLRHERIRRHAEEGPKSFSKERLAAESEDFFGKPRLILFGFGAVGGGIGFLFILPRLIGSLFGAPNAAPISSVLQDLGINLGAAVVCAFLAYQEVVQDATRVRAKEEGALIARLPVELPITPKDGEEKPNPTTPVKLGDMRAERKRRARRPILCIGGMDYCRQCVESSRDIAKAVDRADILIVPVLTDEAAQRSDLAELASGLRHVALPAKDSEDWEQLRSIELQQAKDQGLDESAGLVVVVKKNGRVAMRFLGVPDWRVITNEVNDRVVAGLDTTTV